LTPVDSPCGGEKKQTAAMDTPEENAPTEAGANAQVNPSREWRRSTACAKEFEKNPPRITGEGIGSAFRLGVERPARGKPYARTLEPTPVGECRTLLTRSDGAFLQRDRSIGLQPLRYWLAHAVLGESLMGVEEVKKTSDEGGAP
jgi:hypothetical protein